MKYHSYSYYLLVLILLLIFSCEGNKDGNGDNLPNITAAKRAVGQSANEMLSDQYFTRMTLEIQYMPGFEPHPEMIENLGQFLQFRLNKSSGINLVLREIESEEKTSYSIADIRRIEDSNRTAYNMGNELGMYILILDGTYEEDTGNSFVLGAAYRNTSAVLFGKRIKDNSGTLGRPTPQVLETTVILHEMGHLMGLVNIGSAMVHDHEDPDNQSHCDNENCLMNWRVETSLLFNFLGGSIPTLDQNCLDDLKANGGK
ncbi:zinc metalloprotease [Pararhodonellum marinum]|uniref:hypothetical protein n=1 Tax=Pararhodonellum marinum TaxID=2755358 RepID=UPI001E348DBE|nr:hypothetical protein [Pararhodonellum marinum]